MCIQVRNNLIIRTRNLDDAPQIFEVIDKNRASLREWLLWVDSTNTVSDIEESIARSAESAEKAEKYTLGIWLGTQFIGTIGINYINKISDSAEIGYWLAPEFRGRGIMTDCVRALTSYCFDEMGFNSIRVSCADGNVKSRAVPERLGFVQEAALRECMKYHGIFYDEIIYGMLKRDWQGK